jgi:hypothetical protein
MTELAEQLRDRIEDHSKRVADARRRHRVELKQLRTWPNLSGIERTLWTNAVEARFRGEAHMLMAQAQVYAMLGRTLGPAAPAVDEGEVLAMVEQLTGARPASMPTTMSVSGGPTAGRVMDSSPSFAVQVPTDLERRGRIPLGVYSED